MQKALKPPPPVPPRPSKSLIKEALAKTKDMRRGPTRMAPPPPRNGLVKSSSAFSLNVGHTTPPLDRSVDQADQGSRPIVYQSPNAKGVANARADALRDGSKPHEAGSLDGSGSGNEDSRSRSSTMEKRTVSTGKSSNCSSNSSSNSNSLDKKWDKMLNDRNHVNTLIDEMFASVLEVSNTCEENHKNAPRQDNKIIINNRVSDEEEDAKPVPTTVIVISDERDPKSNASTTERKVQFSDRMNHEFLIEELQHMKEDHDKILKRQRKPSKDVFEENNRINNDVLVNGCRMIESDEDVVKMNTCHITIEDSSLGHDLWVDCDRISKMSHLHGLPPLPKSLSGFGLSGGGRPPPSPARPQRRPDSQKASASLDAQLAILRREMCALRQQDLSLLSQLWSLNESIQDFRAILQEQEGPRGPGSPPAPPLSPAPSSADEDEYYSTVGGGYKPRGGRRASASSGASGSVG